MEESLTIPVNYKGVEHDFPCRVLATGYTHKIEVDINNLLVLFEPDEDQNYRALVDESQLKNIKVEVGLLQAIAKVIESTRK
ncbi:MAG: hypothetical protein M3Q05_08090 [Bacteroidota bacterium]|nr:hypothetical protein [Bacteroidota bacterium]